VYEGGRTRRWLKVKQKGWTVAEDGWRRRMGAGPGSLISLAAGKRSLTLRAKE
jgi:hypothetical protein